MTFPISDVTRRIVYSGSAGVGPYSFAFEVLEQTDIAVYKNTSLLTLTTDYTVTINVDGTGSITLVSAATEADQITIVGDRAVARSTDFVTGGDLFANSLNDEFDSLVIFTQQVKETADRGLKAAITDPTDVNMTLPDKANRKGKVLAFDSTTGDPISGPALDSMITVIEQSANINTVADNIADVNTVADNIADVNTVAGISANVTTVASDIANVITVASDLMEPVSEIQTVAGNIGNVNTVGGISANVTTVAGIAADVTAVAADATDIGTVATNIADVNTVAGISADVTAVAGVDSADLAAVAAIDADVATVAGISANVTTVAGISSNVTTVAGIQANVTTVAGVSANVTTVAGINADVSAVAAIDSDVTAVAADATDIGTVSSNIANVNAVGTNISNVNAVNSNATNINTVAGQITPTNNVSTVAGVSAAVATVAGISSAVSTVSGNSANVTTVAGISTNVTTVAGISANVSTVAGIAANVTSVAGNASNINQVASDTVAINAASANASSAAASATSASASAAAANAVSLGNEPIRHSVRPSLLLDFANTEALDPRITFSRASEGRFYGTQTAKAEENLLLQSQALASAGWGQLRATRTNNADTAPDGTTTATAITQATGQTATGQAQQANIPVVAQSYVMSVFAKPNGKNFLRFVETMSNGSNNVTYFDIQNGTVGTTNAQHTATIQASTEGFYRCIIVFTVNAARTGTFSVGLADTNGSSTVVDSGGILAWGAQLEQRDAVTAYTPTTTQPITNYIPVLQTAASGVARFDHNPTTGESLGLLIEEQRTNLVTYSEDFSDSAWGKVASSITSNTIVAPDGTLTGDIIVANTQNAQHRLDQIPTSSAGSQVLSLYAKSSGYDFLGLRIGSTGTSFNLLTGTVSINSAGSVGEIQSVGNGWYRCSIVVANALANDAVRINITDAVSPSTSFTGDGYSGIYIWGAQLEEGAFPTSYIPTVASQVTRSADAASMTGANFSSWFNNAEGAVYLDYKTSGQTTSLRVASVSDGTGSNKMEFAISSSVGTGPYLFVVTNGTNQVSIGVGTYTSNTNYKWASAYEINNYAWSKDGGSVVSATDALVPVVNQLRIARDGAGGNLFNGTIRKLAYYPKRLTNAELQGLTS